MYKGVGKPNGAVALSGGHYGPRTGAHGVVDEVTEAWKMCKRVAVILRSVGITVHEFYDTVSKNQSSNIYEIKKWHNSKKRVLDVSFHLNAATPAANGCEVLYVNKTSMLPLAEKMSAAISKAGEFRNRGAKYRNDLGFLKTNAPAILLETFFCTNEGDVKKYRTHFEEICFSKARVIAAHLGVTLTKNNTNKPVSPKEEDDEMFTFENDKSMKIEIQNALDAMVKEGLVHKDRADKFAAGKLSTKEATGILYVVFARLARKAGNK